MKKILKLFMLLIICFIITSCNSKYEYKLTEITSNDLLTNLNKGQDFIFAFVNPKTDNYQAFMADLENVVKKSHLNIYYVDYQHMDYSSYATLVDNIDLEYTTSSYYVYKNKNFVVSEKYSNYQRLYKSLKNYTMISDLDITSDKELKENFKKAQEELANGNIGLANNYLNLSWTLKEAKEYYDEQNIFKLINIWENYEFKDPVKLDYTTYHSLLFSNHTNYYVEAIKSGEYATFEKPSKIDEFTFIYYYIKDDIIYTSEKENTSLENYKATYKINSLSDQILNLTDLKKNKQYEYLGGI